ncbi:hypothetical protein MAMO4S_02713 [Mesorhizobium amorphae]
MGIGGTMLVGLDGRDGTICPIPRGRPSSLFPCHNRYPLDRLIEGDDRDLTFERTLIG